MTAFTMESKPTFRNLQGRFVKANSQIMKDREGLVKELQQKFVMYAQQQAPKKTGGFAQGITGEAFRTGDTIGFTVSTPQPLGKWLRPPGTRPHVIRPKGQGYPLRFEIAGRVVFAMSVNHPGYQPKTDFIDMAYKRWQPEAAAGMRRISTRWALTVTGG